MSLTAVWVQQSKESVNLKTSLSKLNYNDSNRIEGGKILGISYLQNNEKSNTPIIGIPEREETEWIEEIFEEIKAEKFPKLV